MNPIDYGMKKPLCRDITDLYKFNGDSGVRMPYPTNGTVGENLLEPNPIQTDNTPAEENIFEADPNDPKQKSTDQIFGPKKFQQDVASNDGTNSESVNENGSKSLNNAHPPDNLSSIIPSHSASTKRDVSAVYGNVMMPSPVTPSGYMHSMGHFPAYGSDIHSQSLPLQPGLITPLAVNPSAIHTRSPSIPTMGFGMVPGGPHPMPPMIAGSSVPLAPAGRVTAASYDPLRYGHSAPYRHPYNFPGALPPHHHTPAYTSASVGHPRISQSQKTSPLPNEYNLPKKFSEVAVLRHGNVVCTVTTTNDRLAITGGKGSVKIWDIGKGSPNVELVGTVDCLADKYIRSCKTTPDRKVVVAGEANYITLFDLGLVKKTQTLIGPENLTKLENNTNACYALALSPDGRLCYGGCSNGFITVWDIISNKVVRAFFAHTDGISCLDISPDGTKLYSGSLDRSTKAWDLRESKLLENHTYSAQVYAIASVPNNEWICAGLENSLIDVTSRSNERFELELHKSSVLSLRVAPTYDWMISVGKDNIVNCIRTPYGPPVYQILEESSVLCCDISPDSKWVITGSSNSKATIYELQY